MAEFCLKCWNEMNGTHYTEDEVTLQEDLCEGCGELKPCIVALEPPGLLTRIWKIWLQINGQSPDLP